jgi:hypothetical protein
MPEGARVNPYARVEDGSGLVEQAPMTSARMLSKE